MKNKPLYIQITLILLICLLIAFILIFWFRNGNNVKFDISENEKTNSGLKHNIDKPMSFCIKENGDFCIGTKDFVNTVSPSGEFKKSLKINQPVTALFDSPEGLYIAAGSSIYLLKQNEEILTLSDLGSNSIVKSIRKVGDTLYVSDAGNKLLYTYNSQGKLIKIYSFETPPTLMIVSPWFDFLILPDDSFWMTNPGNHQMDYYSKDGKYIKSIPDSEETKLFEGCCNPLLLEQISENKLITWEKGVKRLRIFDFSGDVLDEIYVDEYFQTELNILDMTYKNGILYLLDSNRIYTLNVEK